jgi:hypothetical protein
MISSSILYANKEILMFDVKSRDSKDIKVMLVSTLLAVLVTCGSSVLWGSL